MDWSVNVGSNLSLVAQRFSLQRLAGLAFGDNVGRPLWAAGDFQQPEVYWFLLLPSHAALMEIKRPASNVVSFISIVFLCSFLSRKTEGLGPVTS
jgi:hypothetical protein